MQTLHNSLLGKVYRQMTDVHHRQMTDVHHRQMTDVHHRQMTDLHHRKIEELTLEQVTIKHSVSDLELQLQASLASTHNGSFLWRIPDFSRRRREGIEERITSIYSPPFYTGRWGRII